jgi:hypothetical protein
MTVLVATMLTVGRLFTDTVWMAVFVQPPATVPVTVYDVVTVGFTTMELVPAPVLQPYDEAPEAVNVVL